MFFIESGVVRLEVDSGEIDTDFVLGNIESGALLGEMSLFGESVRSASAFAQEEVTAHWMHKETFEALCHKYPQVAMKFYSIISINSGRF